MNLGHAIEALKQGATVSRQVWMKDGSFQWIWLKPASTIKAEWCRDEQLKSIAEANGGEVEAAGVICMKTWEDKICSGWTPSQEDLLAEDYVVL